MASVAESDPGCGAAVATLLGRGDPLGIWAKTYMDLTTENSSTNKNGHFLRKIVIFEKKSDFLTKLVIFYQNGNFLRKMIIF